MRVVSTNIGPRTTVLYNNQEIETGIFKLPVDKKIHLQAESVDGDNVVDRKVHGGVDKACYLYSSNHYPYWKNLYPDLEWDYGMFGENLSIEGLDESRINVGNVYQIGTALVQAVQPRQPCFKLGIKFKDPGILKKFVTTSYSGVYLKVFEPGEVKKGDTLELKAPGSDLSIADVFAALFKREVRESLIQEALANEVLPESCKKSIRRRL